MAKSVKIVRCLRVAAGINLNDMMMMMAQIMMMGDNNDQSINRYAFGEIRSSNFESPRRGSVVSAAGSYLRVLERAALWHHVYLPLHNICRHSRGIAAEDWSGVQVSCLRTAPPSLPPVDFSEVAGARSEVVYASKRARYAILQLGPLCRARRETFPK